MECKYSFLNLHIMLKFEEYLELSNIQVQHSKWLFGDNGYPLKS